MATWGAVFFCVVAKAQCGPPSGWGIIGQWFEAQARKPCNSRGGVSQHKHGATNAGAYVKHIDGASPEGYAAGTVAAVGVLESPTLVPSHFESAVPYNPYLQLQIPLPLPAPNHLPVSVLLVSGMSMSYGGRLGQHILLES